MGVVLVISFFSRKGGTGKSTFVASVASALVKKNKKIAIIDSDPMGSITKWGDKRNKTSSENIDFYREYDDLRKPIRVLKKKYDFLLIDLPGSDCLEMRTALISSDRALLSIKCSEIDKQTIEYVGDVAKEAKKRNKKLQVKSIVNMVSDINSRSDLKSLKSTLTKAKIPPVKGAVKLRETYLSMFKTGSGPHELDDSAAKREITSLIKELKL